MAMQAVRMTKDVSVVVDWTDFAPWLKTLQKGRFFFVPECVAESFVQEQAAEMVSDDEARFSPGLEKVVNWKESEF